MKITRKQISIPPYISTAWTNVAALRLEEPDEAGRQILVVALQDGTLIRIPDLNAAQVAEVFLMHEETLEEGGESGFSMMVSPALERLMQQAQALGNQVVGLPIRLGDGIEGMANAMQHDPAQANMPPLPDEVLAKIVGISKVLGVENVQELPSPEVGCNCFHCQVARAIRYSVSEEVGEEEIEDTELRFREWDIESRGENLYTVSNPLDPSEHYSVYLGEPLGCTCGDKHCQHIKAVLQS
ncbi:MAG: hypothetical protein JSR80_08000 [Verrucomicrobia bacterium]|nr:hypothetical protein [Verrucomicrobiota bacterium]